MPTVMDSLVSQPCSTLTRGDAQFRSARSIFAGESGTQHGSRRQQMLGGCERHTDESGFAYMDRADRVRPLRDDGIALLLRLPLAAAGELRSRAEQEPCYADREPQQGSCLDESAIAQAKLSKLILLMQYLNAANDCSPITCLEAGSVLRCAATNWYDSVNTFVGSHLWLTFSVQALQPDRFEHEHVNQRDVDDFRFLKLFLYQTDVQAVEGARICVIASHLQPPQLRAGNHWNIRHYGDDEIAAVQPPARVNEIYIHAGVGFAQNTLCTCKGSIPRNAGSLLPPLQFALFNHGAMHDPRPRQVRPWLG